MDTLPSERNDDVWFVPRDAACRASKHTQVSQKHARAFSWIEVHNYQIRRSDMRKSLLLSWSREGEQRPLHAQDEREHWDGPDTGNLRPYHVIIIMGV